MDESESEQHVQNSQRPGCDTRVSKREIPKSAADPCQANRRHISQRFDAGGSVHAFRHEGGRHPAEEWKPANQPKHSILVHLRALGFRLVDREELCAVDMSSCRLSGHTDASIFLPCDGARVQAAQQTGETCRTVARQLKCQLRIST